MILSTVIFHEVWTKTDNCYQSKWVTMEQCIEVNFNKEAIKILRGSVVAQNHARCILQLQISHSLCMPKLPQLIESR